MLTPSLGMYPSLYGCMHACMAIPSLDMCLCIYVCMDGLIRLFDGEDLHYVNTLPRYVSMYVWMDGWVGGWMDLTV